MDVSMLIDSADCFDECNYAEGKAIKVTKGGASLVASIRGRCYKLDTLADVCYANDLTHNLLSYCKPEERGFR